jgi:hypothetical protein
MGKTKCSFVVMFFLNFPFGFVTHSPVVGLVRSAKHKTLLQSHVCVYFLTYIVCFMFCYDTHCALVVKVDDVMFEYTCSVQAVCV